MGFAVSDQILLDIVKDAPSSFLVEWAVDQARGRAVEFRIRFANAALDVFQSDPTKLKLIVAPMNDRRAWPHDSQIAQRLRAQIERAAPAHFALLIEALSLTGPSALDTVLQFVDGEDLEVAGEAADTLVEFPNTAALLAERLERQPERGDYAGKIYDILLGDDWTPRSATAALVSLTRIRPSADNSQDYDVDGLLDGFNGLQFECAHVIDLEEWVGDLINECSPVISKELADRVIRSLDKGKAVGAVQALHGAVPSAWLKSPEIPEEHEAAVARCILQILESKRELRERLAKWSARTTCGIIAAAIATLVQHSENQPSSDLSSASLASTIEALSLPKRTLAKEDLWINRAASFGIEAVEPLGRLLQAESMVVFERAVSALEKIPHESSLRMLLAYRSDEPWRMNVVNKAVKPRMRSSGLPLDLSALRTTLSAHDDRTAGMILERWSDFDVEADEITEAVLPYAERLVFSTTDSETFADFVQAHPDPRFLPLVELWRPGEITLAQLSMVLLRTHKPDGQLLSQIMSDYESIVNDIKEWARNPFNVPSTLRVSLSCRQCKAVYTYGVKSVTVPLDLMFKGNRPAAEEFAMIEDAITCKRCGSIDEYSFTKAGEQVLELNARLASDEDFSKTGTYGALTLCRSGSSVGDGLSFSKVLSRLDEKIATQPDDPGAYLARANTYFNMRRLPQALEAYDRLLKRWPGHSEALYQRGTVHSRLKRHAEALEDFKRAALCLKASDPFAKPLEDDLRALLREAARAAEKPVPIEALNALDEVFKALPKTKALTPFPRRSLADMDSPRAETDEDGEFENDGFGDENDEDADDFEADYERQRARIPPNEDRRISQELVGKILVFGKRYVPESDWDEAASRWTGQRVQFQTFMGSEIESEQEHAALTLFIEYRIHDWRPTPDATTLAERYKQDEWPRLTHAEQAQLMHWLERRRCGLFEVEARDESKYISTLRDYFTGETFGVYDFMMAQKTSKGQLFLTAVFPCGQRLELSGALTEVPRHMRFSMESWLRSEFVKWQVGRSKELKNDWSRFFSEQAAEIRRELERIADLPPLVILSTGEPPTPGYAIFDVRNRLAVRTALEGWKALTYVGRHPGNEIEGECFDYLRGPDEGPLSFARAMPEDDQPDGRKVIVMGTRSGANDGERVGSIVFGASQLEIQANSKERVDFLRKELESRAAKGLRFVRESVAEEGFIDRAWKEKDSNVAPEDEMNPEYADVADEYLANHMRAWIDMRLPALNNRTPRQAAADPATRRDVENLLRDMEQTVAHSRKIGPKERNEIRRVRSELGLG